MSGFLAHLSMNDSLFFLSCYDSKILEQHQMYNPSEMSLSPQSLKLWTYHNGWWGQSSVGVEEKKLVFWRIFLGIKILMSWLKKTLFFVI